MFAPPIVFAVQELEASFVVEDFVFNVSIGAVFAQKKELGSINSVPQ